MIEIRPIKACEAPLAKQLWKQVFGDDESYIDLYFQSCYAPEDILVLLQDGRAASMVVCLPVELALPNGQKAKGAYFYALATDPLYRGKGHARSLLAFAHAHLPQKGFDLGLTVPAMPSLFPFFESAGLKPFFYHDEIELSANELPAPLGTALPCEENEYSLFRSGFFFGQASVGYTPAQILWQKRVSRLSGADLFKITVQGQTGYAAAEYLDEDTVILKELLLSPSLAGDALAAISHALPAKTYISRTPVSGASRIGHAAKPFGSLIWYNQGMEKAWEAFDHGYIGLAFD